MIYKVAAFYRFFIVDDSVLLRAQLLDRFQSLALCGTLLVAPEGINGTLAGADESINRMIEILTEYTGLSDDDVKYSYTSDKPFNLLKIRLKKEIITFKQPAADPTLFPGTYVAPERWNDLISDPETIVLDTRNQYETHIGTFEGALDPQIKCFTDFAQYVREDLSSFKHKKIAMFCTGGIRCEKASAFMRSEGFSQVYHLKGGILKYLENVPSDKSKWQGECYVFDRRMAVGQGLTPGDHSMCFCCGYPLSTSDKSHVSYEEGVSCAHCHARTTENDKKRFRTRHHQMMKLSNQQQNLLKSNTDNLQNV
jgi:UPF0176 protein